MLDIPVVSTPHYEIVSELTPTGVLRICLSGEFDMSVGDKLAAALIEAASRPGATRVEVDVASTRFLDSHGIAGLVAGFDAATRAGRTFRVTQAQGMVRQVLDITGLAEILIDGPR
jgi:anti-anti-sigma factor